MKAIEIEGICLIPPLIEFIKDGRVEKEFLDDHIETIDSVITVIACEIIPSMNFSEKDALELICELSHIKQTFKRIGNLICHE